MAAPNRYWAGDITYIPTQKGWLYLAVVIDLYSRKIVGWSMSNRMQAKLVNDALLMAIWQKKLQKTRFGIRIVAVNILPPVTVTH